MENKSIFETLSAINVNSFTEKKNNLTYLSWANAWAETVKKYPKATYDVVKFQQADGTLKPYIYDENLGYMVQTVVTIGDLCIPMQLPVLDGANKAMKDKSYEYTTKYGKKTVEAATMFDINTAIMRCLTKNLAMFGLGHYIYAGEDLPQTEQQVEVKPATPKVQTPKVEAKPQTQQPDEAKTKALDLFSKVDKANVLKHLITVEKLKYASVEDFIKGESIEKIREIYGKLTK